MIESVNALSETKLALWSSTADGTWGDQKFCERHVRWHFDALSDDGREAIVIVFVADRPEASLLASTEAESAEETDRAVFFSYFVDGKAICRASHKLSSDVDVGNVFRLAGDAEEPNFVHTTAPYGTGYSVELDLKLVAGGHVKADLEWLSVESNLMPDDPDLPYTDLKWNIATPRADVSGRLAITEKSGKVRSVNHFRGTGFHDQRMSSMDMIAGSREWLWCRAHFADMTAIFFRFWSRRSERPSNTLVLVRDGVIESMPTKFVFGDVGLFKRGRAPIHVTTDNQIEMRIAPVKTIRCGESFTRYIADISIKADEHGTHRSNGLLETMAVPLWQSRLGSVWKKAKLPWQ